MIVSTDEKGSKSGSRVGTITAVNNPLKFFALALLIVEAIIAILAVRTENTELLKHLSYVATGMFVFVVSMVVVLAFFTPRVLLAQKPSDIPEKIQKREKEKLHLKGSLSDTVQTYKTKGGLSEILKTEPTNEPITITRSGGPKRK